MRIDIWSDFVCPWCYIGKRRFERALAVFEHRDRVQIVHRSFQLNPALTPGEVLPRRDMLMRKYNLSEAQVVEMDARMEQTAAADGLEYHLSGGVTGNTFDAHRLSHLALERGVQDALMERFYRAYFTEQRSLFEVESLLELATDAGLQRNDAERILKGDEYAPAVRADLEEARAFGATGVPFFVFAQKYRLSGAQPPDTFAAALTRGWSETHAFVPTRE